MLNPAPDTEFPRLTLAADIVSPISYPYPKSVIVTDVTAPL